MYHKHHCATVVIDGSGYKSLTDNQFRPLMQIQSQVGFGEFQLFLSWFSLGRAIQRKFAFHWEWGASRLALRFDSQECGYHESNQSLLMEEWVAVHAVSLPMGLWH